MFDRSGVRFAIVGDEQLARCFMLVQVATIRVDAALGSASVGADFAFKTLGGFKRSIPSSPPAGTGVRTTRLVCFSR